MSRAYLLRPIQPCGTSVDAAFRKVGRESRGPLHVHLHPYHLQITARHDLHAAPYRLSPLLPQPRWHRAAHTADPAPADIRNAPLTPGIWHFTLYWTLLLVVGIFFLCSLWASFTLLLSLTTYRDNAAPLQSTDKPPPSEAGTLRAKRRLRRKRPPFWPLIVLPLVMSTIAALVALISGTIVGFSLAAVYSAGGFTMST